MKSKAHGEAPLTPMLECVEYPAQCPCRLRSRVSEIDEYLVPHYATSLEIILTEGVDGYVVIGTNRFDITRDRGGVFVIPPNVVHYTMFRAGSGRIHVFKLSMELIAEVPGFLPERYEEFTEILFRRISYDWQDPWQMFDGLIALFRLIEDCIAKRKSNEKKTEQLDERIRLVMQWTKDHVQERITVEDAAAQLHYSRYYFCRFFREHVGAQD